MRGFESFRPCHAGVTQSVECRSRKTEVGSSTLPASSMIDTTVNIDPNVRVEKNNTYIGFEDIVSGPRPKVGEDVHVRVPETDIRGVGTVYRVDQESRLIYLGVDWSKLHGEPSSDSKVPARRSAHAAWHASKFRRFARWLHVGDQR